MRKFAVLSMDIEDWYHLDYFNGMNCDRESSLLDGVQVYREILAEMQVPSSFFVLGELCRQHRDLLSELAKDNEIASHGWDHTRPLTMSTEDFSDDLRRSKEAIEDAIDAPIQGYRAPCFSLDRERLENVRDIGFLYDSSRMPFTRHPLYGAIDIEGFDQLSPNIYRSGDFLEYQLSALPLAGRTLPVSGGAYVRILPWFLMRRFIEQYLRRNEIYVWYVHPFELSTQPMPPLPSETKRSTRLRFGIGRASVRWKLSRIISLLKARGFRFTTFVDLREELLGPATT